MKTETLIDMLARDAGPAPVALAARRLSPAAFAGVLASAGAAVVFFGLLPAASFATPAPWMKLAYAGALALAAGWLTARLSRPAAPFTRPQYVIAAVVMVMAVLGAGALLSQPSGTRIASLFGRSWAGCLLSVPVLSLPALAASLWAVRGLAPTRLRAAGFAAGLLAGSAGAFGYALSCPEAAPAFVALWYTLGIAATGAIGAALGPRLLRW